MKVLNVNMTISSRYGGGTAERTCQMSKHLSRSGIECSILTLDLGLTLAIRKSLNEVNIVALPCMSERFFVPRLSSKTFKAINEIVAKVDIVHIMGHWSIINALVYTFAHRLEKPYVFCPAGSLVIHGRSRFFKRLYNIIVGKSIIRNASALIASTKDEISYIRDNGANTNNLLVIPNGVDSGKLPFSEYDVGFRNRNGLVNCPFILFVGTFSSIKGPDLLLEAFSRVKDRFASHHLVYAGTDRGMILALKRSIAKFELEKRVHFVGYIDGFDKEQAYRSADLLVVPSRSEVISMVALEAGIRGTPVLVTDQCGFDEVAEFGGGMIVSASVDGLEKGLIRMLGNPDKLHFMGENLKRHIKQHYVWDTVIGKYNDLYNQILKSP